MRHTETLKNSQTGIFSRDYVTNNHSENLRADDDGDSYYEALRNENYRTLLDKEIQLSNARQKASMLTRNSLNSQGLGSSGYGSTMNTSLENSYINALSGAGANYQTQQNVIDQQERAEQQTSANDKFQSLTTLMSKTSSMSELNDVLQSYGYGFYGDDGSFKFDEKVLSSLDSDSKSQLVSLYKMFESQFATSDWTTNNTINGTGFNNAKSAKEGVVLANGDTGSEISNEIDYIYNSNFTNQLEDGYVVKLANSYSPNEKFAYMIYRNGNWYQTNEKTFKSASENMSQVITKGNMLKI